MREGVILEVNSTSVTFARAWARGAKDYQNIILFDQIYIDGIIDGITIEKLIK